MSTTRPTRRDTLRGLATAGIFIPAWNETLEAQSVVCVAGAAPATTEGPYWVDPKLFRSDIRTEPTTGVAREGVPLNLTITIQNLSGSTCTPLVGAYVDIWQCDAKGIYSSVAQAYNPGGGTGTVNTNGQTFLRGYQITDANGQVNFTSIYPGWYTGRAIHIHIRVRTYNGNTVLSNFVSQIFFDQSLNNTILADSRYARTSSPNTQNSNDMIFNVTNRDRMLAAATGNSAGVTASITMGATFQAPTATAPSISSGGVANAVSGAAGAAPGAWISIYGSNLAAVTRSVATSDLTNNILPTTLGNVSVRINDKPAFIQYVSSSQINVLAPSDQSRGSVAVVVTNAAGSVTATTNLATVSPGLSTLSSYVRAVRSDGAIVNGTGNAEAGYRVSAAIGQGDILSLYGSGFGLTSFDLADGTVFSGAYPASNPVTVTIGGVSAAVLYAGLVGPGLYQINVAIPSTLPDGDHAVVARVLDVSSQSSGALVKVAASAKLSAADWSRRRRQWLARGPRQYGKDVDRYMLSSFLAAKPQGEVHDCLVQLA